MFVNQNQNIETKVEKKVKCPKCNPLTRKEMPASELQKSCKTRAY